MAERAGVGDRVIVAPVTFEEVPEVLAAADVAVVPRPHCPGFPVKLLNYMAAARAIVVFEGSANGLQHMKHALVVRDHDWNAMVRAIVSLLCDRELAQELGRTARRWADENLSWPSVAARIEEIYYGLVGSRGHGSRAGSPPGGDG
jgi:glycosyltransferase involved in cell wall biosynthesis